MLDAKIGGMTPDMFDLERQMRALCLEHLAALLAARIVDRNAALGALHVHDEDDGRDATDEHQDCRDRAHLTVTHEFRRTGYSRREARNDAGENDHRNAVADAALGDLLAEPHQKHGARHERGDAGRDQERRARG